MTSNDERNTARIANAVQVTRLEICQKNYMTRFSRKKNGRDGRDKSQLWGGGVTYTPHTTQRWQSANQTWQTWATDRWFNPA